MNCVECIMLLALIQGFDTQTIKGKNEIVDRLENIIQDQARRMESMNAIIQDQVRRMEYMDAIIKDQSRRMESMDAIIQDQATRTESMEKIIADQQKDIKEVKRQHTRIKEICDFTSSNISHVSNGIVLKQTALVDSAKHEFPSKRIATSKAAFYAYMSKIESSPGSHHTLIFDTVKTNINNAYNRYTGIFNTPITGTYVFTFSLRLFENFHGAFEMIKNADVVGTFYNANQLQETVTGIIVINANQADSVFIRTHSTSTISGHIYSDSNGHSSFSGWML